MPFSVFFAQIFKHIDLSEDFDILVEKRHSGKFQNSHL